MFIEPRAIQNRLAPAVRDILCFENTLRSYRARASLAIY
jgi:hypothetical protein